jgi:hypothetical protein
MFFSKGEGKPPLYNGRLDADAQCAPYNKGRSTLFLLTIRIDRTTVTKTVIVIEAPVFMFTIQ